MLTLPDRVRLYYFVLLIRIRASTESLCINYSLFPEECQIGDRHEAKRFMHVSETTLPI